MTPRTISNQMMINLNDDYIKNYKTTMGISKEYNGLLKKLADIEFPEEMELPTPPPVADVAFELGDELYDELYDDSQNESESEDDNTDTDETETEEED